MKILILDLDGVLITTPIWKPDKIYQDGYSEFNAKCVENLNLLLSKTAFEIWLSSTRRTVKSLDEFNQIFENRSINQRIKEFLPVYPIAKNRKEEIELFIAERQLEDFLILDDDKSLNGLDKTIKLNLVLTNSIQGFNEEKLNEAILKLHI